MGCLHLLTKDMMNSTSYQFIPFPQKLFTVTNPELYIPPEIILLFTSLLSVSSTKIKASWGHWLHLVLHYLEQFLVHKKGSIHIGQVNEPIFTSLDQASPLSYILPDTSIWRTPKHLKRLNTEFLHFPLPWFVLPPLFPILMSSTSHLPITQTWTSSLCCFHLPHLSELTDHQVFCQFNASK